MQQDIKATKMATATAAPPLTADGESSSSTLVVSMRQELASLDMRRKALEQEAEVITMELSSPTGDDGRGPPMGIDTPLVDREGYPRADIDLYRARSLRGRLAEIRTDHKRLMAQIEGLLFQLASLTMKTTKNIGTGHAEELQARLAPKPKPKYDPVSGKWVVENWDGTMAGDGGKKPRSFDTVADSHSATTAPPAAEMSSISIYDPSASPSPAPSTPFAKVNNVAPHSPAAIAGLQEGDVVLQFGPICSSSGDPMSKVAELVPQVAAQNQSISILVQRHTTTTVASSSAVTDANSAETSVILTLQLTPKPWEGRGLLGCHIVPCL